MGGGRACVRDALPIARRCAGALLAILGLCDDVLFAVVSWYRLAIFQIISIIPTIDYHRRWRDGGDCRYVSVLSSIAWKLLAGLVSCYLGDSETRHRMFQGSI